MSIDAMILFIGGLILVLPFSGIPLSFMTPILVISGLALVALGIAVRRRAFVINKSNRMDTSKNQTYTEHTPDATSNDHEVI